MKELKISQRSLDILKDNKCIGWVTIHPKDFLRLTVEGPVEPWIKEEAPYTKTLEEYNSYKDIHAPWLDIRMTDGKVLSHDGRHRAMAVLNAGGTKMKIGVCLCDARGFKTYYVDKYTDEEIEALGDRMLMHARRYLGKADCPTTLKGQFSPVSVAFPLTAWGAEFWTEKNTPKRTITLTASTGPSPIMIVANAIQGCLEDHSLADRVYPMLDAASTMRPVRSEIHRENEYDLAAYNARAQAQFRLAAAAFRAISGRGVPINLSAAIGSYGPILALQRKELPENMRKNMRDLKKRRKKAYDKYIKSNDPAEKELNLIRNQIDYLDKQRRPEPPKGPKKVQQVKPVEKTKTVKKTT